MKKLLLLPILTLMAFGQAFAQESPGIEAPESDKGSVRKNRAPVAEEILKVKFPKPKNFTLSNGLRVYILEDHRVPGMTITLIINAGSLYADKAVVGEVAGRMLAEGTTTKSDLDIARIVDGMGAELNTGVGTEWANISISGLSDFTEPMLDLMVDVALHPSYPQKKLEDYIFQRISRLPSRKADPDTLVRDLANRVNYDESRYARRAATKEELEAVTREEMLAFHKKYFVPNGATLTLTGDVKAEEIMPRIRELFKDWKPAPEEHTIPPATFAPEEKTKVHLIDRPGSQQTELRFTNIAIARNSPDYIPLVVANRILGAGSTGRLFQKIREEKGYTYGAYSSLSATRWPGTWGAYASVRTEVTGPAVEEFLNEFRRIQQEPVTDEELARAKRTIIGSFARTLESPDGILSRSMEIVRNNLAEDYWETYPARIQAVTKDDVLRVARQYLGDNRIQIVAVGEGSVIKPVLAQFGPVIEYDTDIKPITSLASAAP